MNIMWMEWDPYSCILKQKSYVTTNLNIKIHNGQTNTHVCPLIEELSPLIEELSPAKAVKFLIALFDQLNTSQGDKLINSQWAIVISKAIVWCIFFHYFILIFCSLKLFIQKYGKQRFKFIIIWVKRWLIVKIWNLINHPEKCLYISSISQNKFILSIFSKRLLTYTSILVALTQLVHSWHSIFGVNTYTLSFVIL